MKLPHDKPLRAHRAHKTVIFLSLVLIFAFVVFMVFPALLGSGAVIKSPEYNPRFVDFWLVAFQIGGAGLLFTAKTAAKLLTTLGTWKISGSPLQGVDAASTETDISTEATPSLSSAERWVEIFMESSAKVAMTFVLTRFWKRKEGLPENQATTAAAKAVLT